MKTRERAASGLVVAAVSITLLSACAAPHEEVRDRQVDAAAVSQPSPVSLPAPTEPAATDIAPTGPAVRPLPPTREAEVKARTELMVGSNGQAAAMDSSSHRFIAPCCIGPVPVPPRNTERYGQLDDNPVHRVVEQPVSTFSIDVDTGAYANVRRFLNEGQLPPDDAVRVEEMLNYFDYSYAAPDSRETPFKVTTELAATPWNADSQLLRIGIQGYEVPANERPASNLVFLIDVSGSMQSPDKLPLLKNAFRLLTQQLSSRDRISMVVYAGATGVVLEPTAGDHKHRILDAIAALEAGGSTNGGAGIDLAYRLARDGYIKGGINRVILATDGDFNVGTVSFESLIDKAERERASGVALTTLGFGTGNLNETLLEQLADAGNGNYAYVDTLAEARKVLVEELSSTLFTIARDVKIQVEFNPELVAEYRLIGYENRLLNREDFNNDRVDAGDIGAGHSVTALYELVPVGKRGSVDPLRYGREAEAPAPAKASGEVAFVRLRYKAPDSRADSNDSKLIEFPVQARSARARGQESADFRFAASVAAFGQKLRGGRFLGDFGYGEIRALAKPVASDAHGYRREFLALVDLAESLRPSEPEGHGRMSQRD